MPGPEILFDNLCLLEAKSFTFQGKYFQFAIISLKLVGLHNFIIDVMVLFHCIFTF